jgi:hypothetical protein
VSVAPESRPAGRVRRRRETGPREISQQVLLTAREREQLRARAGELGVSVPRLLVESALSGVETPAERRAWIAELFELRRLLATIANSCRRPSGWGGCWLRCASCWCRCGSGRGRVGDS